MVHRLQNRAGELQLAWGRYSFSFSGADGIVFAISLFPVPLAQRFRLPSNGAFSFYHSSHVFGGALSPERSSPLLYVCFSLVSKYFLTVVLFPSA